MDHFRQVEFDNFDSMDDTIYIMVVADDGEDRELVSGMRLRPTTARYELEMESYRYLTEGVELPRKVNVMEGSRWVGRSSRTPEGMISTGMLMMALARYCRSMGVDQVIGTISTKSEKWLGKRSAPARRGSQTYYSDRDALTIMISTIHLDEAFVSAAQNMLAQGLTHYDLTDLAFEGEAA